MINPQKIKVIMYNRILYIAFSVVFTFIYQTSYGQVTDTIKPDLNFNQVEVVKSFEANLIEAKIQNVNPIQPKQEDYAPKFKYDITIVPLALKYPDPQIKPLAMNPDGPFVVKNGFLDASYAYLVNPRVHTGYSISKKDEFNVGGTFFFESLDNSKQNSLQKYLDGNVAVFGSKLVKENTELFATLGGDYRARNLYQVYDFEKYQDQTAKRSLLHMDAKAGIKNVESTNSGWNYETFVKLDNLVSTNTKADEIGFQTQGYLGKNIGEKSSLGLNASYDYIHQNVDTTRSISVIDATAKFRSAIGKLFFTIGGDIIYTNGKSSIFPHANFEYSLIQHTLQVFAGVKQNKFVNSLNNLSMPNPYFIPDNSALLASITQTYFGGIRGNYDFLKYEGQVGFKSIQDAALYDINAVDTRFYNVIYDDMHVFFIGGSIDFSFNEQMSLGGNFQQNIYDPKTESHAWYLPLIDLSSYFKWRLLENKLLFQADLYFATPSKYRDELGNIGNNTLRSELGMNLKYKFSDAFSAYIKAQNLLNNGYERFYGYPIAGTNFGAGIRVLF